MDLNDLAKNPEQIKNLISILEALLPKKDNETNNNDVKPKKNKIKQTSPRKQNNISSAIKTKGGRRAFQKDNTSVNKFEKMTEFNLHKEDIAVDKLLSKAPPVARNREEVEPILVNCRICGKKESVNPSLIFESVARYKCNNCSTQSG